MYITYMGYDYDQKRYAIVNKSGNIYHFHCGDCFDVEIDNKWVPTRIEYGKMSWGWDWYLVGVHNKDGESVCGAMLKALKIRL